MGLLLITHTGLAWLAQRPPSFPSGLPSVGPVRPIENPYSLLPQRLWDLVNNRVLDMDAFAASDGTLCPSWRVLTSGQSHTAGQLT